LYINPPFSLSVGYTQRYSLFTQEVMSSFDLLVTKHSKFQYSHMIRLSLSLGHVFKYPTLLSICKTITYCPYCSL